jgi:hypothetical protein
MAFRRAAALGARRQWVEGFQSYIILKINDLVEFQGRQSHQALEGSLLEDRVSEIF